MNKIKYCRELNEMSQKYVAVSVGVSAPMVSQWESGIKEPSKENIVKLADLFGVTTDYLLDHEVSLEGQHVLPDERHLISCFRQLNRNGKKTLLEMSEALLKNADYRQEASM